LLALYTIIKEQAHPELYHCTPRELILHSTFDWDLISKHLELLEADGMIKVEQGNMPSYCMTEKGIQQTIVLSNEVTRGIGDTLNKENLETMFLSTRNSE
jgi:predicted transcriptional regulator